MYRCSNIIPLKKERIFNNMEYDKTTKLIYKSCIHEPIGKVINGKIFWFKK